MRLPIPLAVCAVLAGRLLAAQEPAFDVASIRLNQAASQRSEIQLTPMGRFNAISATPRSIILRAHGLVDAQLIDAPQWLSEERYDIDARVAATPAGGPDSLLPHVRALLVDRFKLRARPETRELPAHALTFARRDRTPGPQMRPTQTDCIPTRR